MRRVSYDLSLRRPMELADGSTMSALEMQWEYFDLARKYADDRGLESVGGDDVGGEILRRWESVLTALETDFTVLADQLDWVAKLQLFTAYKERNGLAWDDPKLAMMDIRYHDLRPEKSLFARLKMERLVSTEDIENAVTEPPTTTRAYFRGKCLQRWAPFIAAANWDSLVFDLGSDPLKRVGMMEPLRGTKAIVDTLLDGCSSPAELLERMGS
jgi:proteasome accessory factor A